MEVLITLLLLHVGDGSCIAHETLERANAMEEVSNGGATVETNSSTAQEFCGVGGGARFWRTWCW